MCNCRKKATSRPRSVVKKTSTSSPNPASAMARRTGTTSGRRIITRKIK